jgi:hypothetical protein
MKNLIDYAYQDNGTDFRAELYAAIHDKVAAHIEAKKQEIASGLMGQNEAKEDREDEEHYRSRQAKDEKAAPSEESHEEKMARKKLNKEEFELDEDAGAYETWDPKHPHFAKNYKKYQSDNANQGSIKDFIEKEKARPRRLPEEVEALDELSTKTYQKYTSSATGPHNMERLFKGNPKQAQASAGIKRASAGIESNKLKELQNHIGSDKETAIAVGNRVKEFLGKNYDHNDDLHRKAALQIHKRLSK